MELDPSFKQVIPYLVLRDGERYFLMQRTRAGGDARLHDRYSIGVGGHLNPGDGGLLGGLAPRMGARSSSPTSCPAFRLVALLNDDTTEVGAVHLGAVYRRRRGRPAGRDPRDRQADGPRSPSRPEVRAVADRLETWSRLVFEDLTDGVPVDRRGRRPIIATPGPRPADPHPATTRPGGLMAAKILVVDDDPNVQRLLQYTLKQEGYDVVVASDGAEGFRLWGAEAPDLILLDVMLPKLDGYQVATKIRTEEGTVGHVPIIMLTAEQEVEQKVRGLRAGADDYLIKPFHPAELLARIKSLLARFAPRDVAPGASAARSDPRVLRRQGRRRDDDHRDQRGDRAPPRARAQGLPGRRQPAVRRPPRLPRPRPRPQEHRRRRDAPRRSTAT